MDVKFSTKKKVALLFLFLSIVIGFLFQFPQYGLKYEEEIFQEYEKNNNSSVLLNLPVMTFNIRYDGEEYDPNNHFTKRIFRIRDTLQKWNPFLVGMQESLYGQLLHLKSEIPKKYNEVGHKRNHQGGDNSNIYQVAMLYDTEQLELLEQDYLWLSKTPRIEGSKDFDSKGIRTVNIARFRLKYSSRENDSIIAVNTHLDAFRESARRGQAQVLINIIKEWREKYPESPIILLGDFNTAPYQYSYNIITSYLNDTWNTCKSKSSSNNQDDICISNSISSSFHGWLGSFTNYYGARYLQWIAFTLHGMGFEPPRIVKDLSVIKDLVFSVFDLPFPFWEAVPDPNRLHVDWILYKNPEINQKEDTSSSSTPSTSSSSLELTPKLIAVVDVRNFNYSSDHFPIVALFQHK